MHSSHVVQAVNVLFQLLNPASALHQSHLDLVQGLDQHSADFQWPPWDHTGVNWKILFQPGAGIHNLWIMGLSPRTTTDCSVFVEQSDVSSTHVT